MSPPFLPSVGREPRSRSVRANASEKGHVGLDESLTLDEGDPQALAAAYASWCPRIRR